MAGAFMAGGFDAQDAVAEAFLCPLLEACEALQLRTRGSAGGERGWRSCGQL